MTLQQRKLTTIAILTAMGNHNSKYILPSRSMWVQAQDEVVSLISVPRGKLRVSLPVIGYRMLLPILPIFHARYPNIELELDFNDNLIDVIAEGMDVVIRGGELTDSRLSARQLGPFRFHILGAPVYFAKHGIPQTPQDLQYHACLHYKFPTTGKLQQWGAIAETMRLPITMSCNNIEALIRAASQGLGLAYLPDFAVRQQMISGELQAALNEHTTAIGIFSIVWPSSRYLLPKVRVFIDFICEHILFSTEN